jgi:Na+/H+-dicarboxylate symporter
MNIFKSFMRTRLHTKILLGLIAGVPVGLLLGPRAESIEPLGRLFILLIRMIVVPLVFSSLFVGTASLGNIRKLGRIGAKTILYYLCTTAIAITIGLLLANAVRPGSRLAESTKAELLDSYRTEASESIERAKTSESIRIVGEPGGGIAGAIRSLIRLSLEALIRIVPSNPVQSLAEENMLQIIFFALLFGIAITLVPGGRGKPVIDFFAAVSEGMVQLVHIVMKLAPIGVLALIAAVVGRFGLDILFSLIRYSLVVVAGLLIHMIVIYSSAVRILGKTSPIQFFRGIRPAQLIAFSTSSSNATLPVTIECAEENLGISDEVASFVLPLGATINMDGTALYQGVAAVFIAQVYGLSLTLGDQLTIVLMATLASIGAAGVPGIGIITLTMVLQTLGLPLEGIALILGVDRILDMCRTTVNITGDASAALIVAASEGEIDRTPKPEKGTGS